MGIIKQNLPNHLVIKSKVARVKSRGICIIKPLSLSSCEVEFLTQIKWGGRIPSYLVNRQMGNSLSFVPDLIEFYDRSAKIDAAESARFAELIPSLTTQISSTNSDNSTSSSIPPRSDNEKEKGKASEEVRSVIKRQLHFLEDEKG